MKPFIICFFILCFFTSAFSQKAEDESKMVREVITLEVEKAKYAPKTPTVQATEVKGKKTTKKKVEEPPPISPEEEAAAANPMMPAPVSEVVKRAQNWYNSTNSKFTKSNGVNSGQNVTCNVAFVFKQKMLNPENDVDGQITMTVLIEAKEGKYRYTIKNIKHIANRKEYSGGDVFSQIPACGSMALYDKTWKQIRAQALANAKIVADDLKLLMKSDPDSKKDDW